MTDDLWFDTGVQAEETGDIDDMIVSSVPSATIIDPAVRFWEANAYKVRLFTFNDLFNRI